MDAIFDLETIGLIVGAVITLMIFSYILSDNFLYRWALALLVGGGVGYAMGTVWHFVLIQWASQALGHESILARIFYFVPLFLGVLLLFKGFGAKGLLGRISVLSNISMGYLLGVGAAVAISGAVLGTLVPQIKAVGNTLTFSTLLQGIVMLAGTVTALLVFSPRPRMRNGEMRPVMLWYQRVGRFFITVALAAAFAGAITSALTTLTWLVWQFFQLIIRLSGGG